MSRFTLVRRETPSAKPLRTRKTVDLTAAQADALEQMIKHAEQAASDATGLEISIGIRQFFHMLLKQYAESVGIEWPDDYPTHGGKRG
ncbi:MAG: hypothetical protein JW963_06420 [Anaerolineales bacterium]|nr:hypothetical protein [Anaerolineales bacterium]